MNAESRQRQNDAQCDSIYISSHYRQAWAHVWVCNTIGSTKKFIQVFRNIILANPVERKARRTGTAVRKGKRLCVVGGILFW